MVLYGFAVLEGCDQICLFVGHARERSLRGLHITALTPTYRALMDFNFPSLSYCQTPSEHGRGGAFLETSFRWIVLVVGP